MVMVRPAAVVVVVVHWRAASSEQRVGGAGGTELGDPRVPLVVDRTDGRGDPAGQVTVAVSRLMSKRSL
jgi:hypothetical protein